MAETPRRPPGLGDAAWKQALYSLGKIDRDLAIRWLGVHWIPSRRNCASCSSSNWGIGDDIVRLQTIKGPAYPSIAVVCNVCGYTMLFNAVRMGLLAEGPDVIGHAKRHRGRTAQRFVNAAAKFQFLHPSRRGN